jgi:hypothetical protein
MLTTIIITAIVGVGAVAGAVVTFLIYRNNNKKFQEVNQVLNSKSFNMDTFKELKDIINK